MRTDELALFVGIELRGLEASTQGCGIERTTRISVTCNALLASFSKDRSPPVERSPDDRVPDELVLSRTRYIKL